MKFIVFYLQLINSLEGLGMFFSSAALIRRLRKHTATFRIDGSVRGVPGLSPQGQLSIRAVRYPSPARDETPKKILLRMPCGHTFKVARISCNQELASFRMP